MFARISILWLTCYIEMRKYFRFSKKKSMYTLDHEVVRPERIRVKKMYWHSKNGASTKSGRAWTRNKPCTLAIYGEFCFAMIGRADIEGSESKPVLFALPWRKTQLTGVCLICYAWLYSSICSVKTWPKEEYKWPEGQRNQSDLHLFLIPSNGYDVCDYLFMSFWPFWYMRH